MGLPCGRRGRVRVSRRRLGVAQGLAGERSLPPLPSQVVFSTFQFFKQSPQFCLFGLHFLLPCLCLTQRGGLSAAHSLSGFFGLPLSIFLAADQRPQLAQIRLEVTKLTHLLLLAAP